MYYLRSQDKNVDFAQLQKLISSTLKRFVEPKYFEIFPSSSNFVVSIDFRCGIGLEDLNLIAKKLSSELLLSDSSISISPRVNETRVGVVSVEVILPYVRRLLPSEVKSEFFYIVKEWRDFFPPPNQEFKVLSNDRIYTFACDLYSRVRYGVRSWYLNHPDVEVGDLVVFQKVSATHEKGYEYKLLHLSRKS